MSEPGMAWAYSLDGWKKIVSPFTDDDRRPFCEWLQANGFETGTEEIGNEWLPGAMRIYRCEADEPTDRYQYFVQISEDSSRYVFVFVENFPALCRLAQEVYPLLMSAMATDHNEAVGSFVERVFRLWHGHPLETACRKCDPVEYESQQMRKRERERARRAIRQRDHVEGM